MEENRELMFRTDASDVEVLKKWLHVLYLTQIAQLVLLAMGLIRSLDNVIMVVGRLLSVVVLAALYQLSSVNGRYRKAAGFFLIGLIGGVMQLFWGSNLLTSAASICGIVATYQEYTAHAELLCGRDTNLADKWNSLFYWGLGVGIVGGFISIGAVVLGVGAGMAENTVVTLAFVLVVAMEVPIEVLRLKYLKRTKAILTEE